MRKHRTVAIVALVFIAELLAVSSLPIWIRSVSSSDWLAYLAGAAGLDVWTYLAGHVGPISGPVFTPLARALLFALAVIAVWTAGYHTR